MINNEKCRERFNKFIDGKENEGYVEWKKWVITQTETISEDNLSNMIKRIEIKLKSLSEGKNELGDLMSQFVVLATVLVSAIVTIFMTTLQIQVSSYDKMISYSQAAEFADLVNTVMQDTSRNFTLLFAIFVIAIFLLYFFATVFDKMFETKRKKNKIYYEELLMVLKEELDKRKEKNLLHKNV